LRNRAGLNASKRRGTNRATENQGKQSDRTACHHF
jgi:hypothetical protein